MLTKANTQLVFSHKLCPTIEIFLKRIVKIDIVVWRKVLFFLFLKSTVKVKSSFLLSTLLFHSLATRVFIFLCKVQWYTGETITQSGRLGKQVPEFYVTKFSPLEYS